MFNLSNQVSFLWRSIYFIFAHIPTRIIANIILYLAIISLMLHFASFYIEKNPKKLEHFIQKYLLIYTNFSSIKINYNLLKPSIKLKNIIIYQSSEKKQGLYFKSAYVSINVFKSLLFLSPQIEHINLSGLTTTITRQQNSHINIGTLSSDTSGTDIPSWLLQVKSLSLSNSKLSINDENLGLKNYQLNDINLIYQNKNQWQHHLSLSVKNQQLNSEQLPITFDSVIFNAEFKGNTFSHKDWAGKFYVNLSNLQYSSTTKLNNLLEQWGLSSAENKNIPKLLSGKFTAEIWGEFSKSSILTILAKLTLEDLKLKQSQKQLNIKQLTTLLKINKNDHFLHSSQLKQNHKNVAIKNWLLSLYQLNLITKNIVKENSVTEKINIPYAHLDILKKSDVIKINSYVEELSLGNLENILSFVNDDLTTDYKKINPRGKLNKTKAFVEMTQQKVTDFSLSTNMEKIKTQASEYTPQVVNLSANLWVNKDYGVIDIDSTNISVFSKEVFRHPLNFDSLKSQISWQSIASQWWIKIHNNVLKNAHLHINGDAQLWLNKNSNEEQTSPLLLINAYFNHTDPSYTPYYLPYNTMGEELVNWLDNAFVSAHVPSGGILFRGRLNQFPYIQHDGLMEINFYARKLLLNYYENWPKLHNINADIQFTHKGMNVEVENAQIYNSSSQKTKIKIKDYLTSGIDIHSNIQTNAKDTMAFLQATELLDKDFISQLETKGKVNIDLSLHIPEGNYPLRSRIKADFKNLLFTPQWLQPLKVSKLKGKLIFDDDHLSNSTLNGIFNHHPMQVKITNIVDKKLGSKNKKDATQITINGAVNSQLLSTLKLAPKSMGPLLSHIKGETTVQAKLVFDHENENLEPNVILHSNLKGITSTLPTPFNKTKKQVKPLNLNYTKDKAKQNLTFNYDHIISYCQQSDKKYTKLNKTHINVMSSQCKLPLTPQLLVTGKIDLTHLAQWQSLFNKHQSQQELTFNQPLKFDLQELILPTSILGSSADKKDSIAKQQKQTKSSPSINFFSINGVINKLTIGNADLGKLKIQSRNELEQIVFDKIDLQSEQVSIELKGYTQNKKTNPTTELKGSMSIKNTGKLLKELDYFHNLKKADSNFNGYLKWHGSILSFSGKNLFGKVKFQTSKGSLEDIDPGIGRIIGLINLNDLKHRLGNFGDTFKDVTQEGFQFQEIKGNLLFNQSNLYTRDIHLKSNIAKITTDGSINLDSKTCNYLVTVIPDISSGLPYAGLALAGPAGAAIGFLSQQVLGSEINKISQYQYNLTGLCKEPVISNQKLKKNKVVDGTKL